MWGWGGGALGRDKVFEVSDLCQQLLNLGVGQRKCLVAVGWGKGLRVAGGGGGGG